MHASSLQPFKMSPSTPKSPNSLIIKAIFLSPALFIKCLIKVVFPAPKKPVITVVGILFNIFFSLPFCKSMTELNEAITFNEFIMIVAIQSKSGFVTNYYRARVIPITIQSTILYTVIE